MKKVLVLLVIVMLLLSLAACGEKQPVPAKVLPSSDKIVVTTIKHSIFPDRLELYSGNHEFFTGTPLFSRYNDGKLEICFNDSSVRGFDIIDGPDEAPKWLVALANTPGVIEVYADKNDPWHLYIERSSATFIWDDILNVLSQSGEVELKHAVYEE